MRFDRGNVRWPRAVRTLLALVLSSLTAACSSGFAATPLEDGASGASRALLRSITQGSPTIQTGFYYIQNLARLNFLDGHQQCATENGCKVQLWSRNLGAIQKWNVTPGTEPNTFTIVNTYGNLCLDGNLNGQGHQGTRVQLWQCNGREIQDWFILPYGTSGEYVIVNYLYNRPCLDGTLPGGIGSPVQLWKCLPSSDGIQVWNMILTS